MNTIFDELLAEFRAAEGGFPAFGNPALSLPTFQDEELSEPDGPCCSNPDHSSPCPNHDDDTANYNHDQMHADRETAAHDAE